MTAEAKHPSDDDARWGQLLEAHACGELSEAERVELEQLSAKNFERRRELELIHELSALPRLEATRSAEDDRLIEDVLAQHQRLGRRHRLLRWSAAAAVLVPLAAAAAYVNRANELEEAPLEPLAMTPPSTISRSIVSERSVVSEQADEQPPQPEATPEPPPPAAAASGGHARTPSPAELLARAQKARAARNYARAVAIYDRLLARYPRSGEARVAEVSMGQLQLAQGKAAAALAKFDAYERSGGPLAQEAHYGKIQALRALGRTAEERGEIQRFIGKYPQSLQVAALKRRLEAADGKE